MSACSADAVPLQTFTPQPSTSSACAALAEDLPGTITVAGTSLERRDVSGVPTGAVARAWGDPPVVLRCGVPRPTELRRDSQLFTVDGVSWLAVHGKGGYFFTATGRTAYVEVSVPSAYAPEAGVLTKLAQPIRTAVPAA